MTDVELARFERCGVVTVVPRSATGLALGDDPALLLRHRVAEFLPAPGTVDRLAGAYARQGLTVEARTEVGLTVSGDPALLAEVFGHPVRPVRNKYIRGTVRYEFTAAGPLRSRLHTELVEEVRVPRAGFELSARAPGGVAATPAAPVGATPPLAHDARYLWLPEDAVRVAGAADRTRPGSGAAGSGS